MRITRMRINEMQTQGVYRARGMIPCSAKLMTPTTIKASENAGVLIADQFLPRRLGYVIVPKIRPRRLSENISRPHIEIQKSPNRNVNTGMKSSYFIA